MLTCKEAEEAVKGHPDILQAAQQATAAFAKDMYDALSSACP